MATAPTPLACRNHQPSIDNLPQHLAILPFSILLTLDRSLFLILQLSRHWYFSAAISAALGSNSPLRCSDITRTMVPPRQVARALPCPDWEEKSEPRYDAATPETFDIDGLLALGPKVSYSSAI